MANTDENRFIDALKYLEKVAPTLAPQVKKELLARVQETSKDISLEGMGYWRSGNDAQHNAVRALLLCQKAFLTPDYFKGFFIKFDKDKTKQYWRNKPESEVLKAISCYLPKPGATHQSLVKAAEEVNQTTGDFDFYTLARDSKNLGANPICFAAVRLWLFKAGFVSIRWLASEGFNLTANTANTILGNGQEITLANLNQIPAGHIFNFHAPGHKEVCHWGLSIGNGEGLAANTTQQFLKSQQVKFKAGDSKYGRFLLSESYDACKWKYKLASEAVPEEIIIRDIDPTLVSTYY